MDMVSKTIILTGRSPQLAGLSWRSASRLRIGKGSGGIHIELSDPTVDALHAEVARSPQGWIVRDLGSRNGTFLNKSPLEPQRPYPLEAEDILQLGRMVLSIDFIDEETPEETTLPTAPVGIQTTRSFVKVEASTKQSWDEAIEGVTPPGGQGPWPVKHLRALLRAGCSVCSVGSLDEMLGRVLEDIVQVLDAQRGSILVADSETGELKLRKVSVARPGLEGQTHSRTLANRSFEREESLLCADVQRQGEMLSAGSVMRGAMSSIICALLRTPRKKIGVLHLDRGPLQAPFTRDELHLADAITATLSVGVESALLVQQQEEQFVQTIAALGRTVELRDAYTANHTTRVSEYSLLLAEAMGVTPDEMALIRVGAPLHDIGKVGIPDAILQKPGPLTAAELEEMKTHTVKGALILETIPTLRKVIPIARHHHERWDGNGYPDGIAGETISRPARIVAVADVFDALTSDRPYRRALPNEVAFAEIARGTGSHFDPHCAKAFLELREQIEEIHRKNQEPDPTGLQLLPQS